MVKLQFIYNKNIYENNYAHNTLVEDILKEYSSLIFSNANNLFFSYKGKNLSLYSNKKIIKFNKNIIRIVVFDLNKKPKNKKINQILCPICKELAFLKINNDKIIINHLFNKDNHSSDLNVNEFIKNLYNDESNIECHECGNTKNLYNKFFKCSCGKNICPLCKIFHDKVHNIIEYDKRFNLCIHHNIEFISYCEKCKINLCFRCEEEHYKHKKILFKSIYPNKKILNENKNNIKECINNINKNKLNLIYLEEYISEFINETTNNFNDYNELYEFILNYFNNIVNYQSLMNVINLFVDF